MALRLIDRITTLLKADAHGVIESLEERSLLLKQYVREAELELDRKRARLEALRDEEKRARDLLERREEEIRALDEDVALALSGGKDDLARFAIRRLLPKREEVRVLRAQIDELAGEAGSLGETVGKQTGQLEELRARVRVEIARGAEAAPCPAWATVPAVAEEEVELELLRRRGGAEGGPR